jgi:catechol 2,3-dioxygenase-like lactoylglutathione lyase family enzyme
MDAMADFYTQAFGAAFREVEMFGLPVRQAQIASLTLKLVPLRDTVDLVDYPVHQLGFSVDNVHAVVRLATLHGGGPHGDVLTDGDRMRAAVRDPDGNTIELEGTA